MAHYVILFTEKLDVMSSNNEFGIMQQVMHSRDFLMVQTARGLHVRATTLAVYD